MYFDKSAMRASGLIPVIPPIVINKDTQLPMYIEGQEIIYWCSGWDYNIYLYQPEKIHNVLYYNKYEQGSCKASAGYTHYTTKWCHVAQFVDMSIHIFIKFIYYIYIYELGLPRGRGGSSWLLPLEKISLNLSYTMIEATT